MIAYPANFPPPTTSFSSEVETPLIRTDLSVGLVEQEGRFSTARRKIEATWELSDEELLVFEEWFANDLLGGVLIFGMTLQRDGAIEEEVPVRFVGGTYKASHMGALWWSVTANLEQMLVESAPSNRTPAVPMWTRLEVDPMTDQVLTLSHRNALLIPRPTDGNITTLRIFPPTSKPAWIYFGVKNMGAGDVLVTSQDVDPIPGEPTIFFPGELPGVNSGAFEVSSARLPSRLDMESGHSRQWARFQTANKSYRVQWEFDVSQLHTFQDFFFTTLKSGGEPFMLQLPVDNLFTEVPVRFTSGTYSESYSGVSRFIVSAQVERVVDQTATPESERPFPVYYSPTVNVTANRKILAGDAGKFFVVNPAEGQTISLHIYDLEIEFGLLVIGMGNVLITRGPFIVDLGLLEDLGTSGFTKPSFDFRTVTVDAGTVGDGGSSAFAAATFTITTVAKDIGTLSTDTAGSSFATSTFEVLEVQVDAGSQSDGGAAPFAKPIFTIDIP